MRRRTPTDFLADETAATSIEYAVVAGFLSILIAAGARVIGQKLSANYYAPVADAFN
jgi:Flp pilus assembly pilin Flp